MESRRGRVCGQCSNLTYDEEYSCPNHLCKLVLCATCSDPSVHSDDDESCPPWWGESLTEEEVAQRMREAS